jgi:homocitrate synthase NifV
MASANAIAALEAGASCADVTVLGLGERAGNAALEEVAMAIRSGAAGGLATRVDAARLPALCARVASIVGRPIPAQKAIVGDGVFDHESGIHVRAMLVDPRAYEPFSPSLIGRERRLVIGKHSGRASVRAALGLDASAPVSPALMAAVQREAREAGGHVSVDRLRWLYDACDARPACGNSARATI